MKRIFKKVYSNLAFPPCNLIVYTNVAVEYGEYDNSLEIEVVDGHSLPLFCQRIPAGTTTIRLRS